jgi:glucose-1-phosphate thymidylyltransferase
MHGEVVGVVPMAGHGTRLGRLPFSKELFPVGVDAAQQPLVVSQHVLEQIRRAGAHRALIVLREGKWDIPAYYKHGVEQTGLHLAYVLARQPFGVPFSLDSARPFTAGALVAMGFPDILIHPPDAMTQVVHRHRTTGADVVLGLFPWTAPPSDDLVETDHAGRVVGYYGEQSPSRTAMTWALMTWGQRFADFMQTQAEAWLTKTGGQGPEFRMGTVLASAVSAGLLVQSRSFPSGRMLDVGSPAGQSRLAGQPLTSAAGWVESGSC